MGETDKGKNKRRRIEKEMHFFSKEGVRESVEMLAKGVIITTFAVPLVIPVVNQYVLERLPDVVIEGMANTPKQEAKTEELPEFNWSNFVSTYQEEIELTKEKEKRFIEGLILLEAGPSKDRQILVAEVIRNRTKHPDFPDETIQVCNQDGQFQPVQNGVLVNNQGIPLDLEAIPEMEEVYEKVFVQNSNETEELLKKEALKNGLQNEKYWKGGALYFSNLEAVSQEVYAKGQYDQIKVSVKVGGNTYWRYWG